jgi:hypothetical protein
MKSFVRNALLGAAGLVALSLSAHAAGSTAVTDTPLFNSAPTTKSMQLAQSPDFSRNAGGVGFKQSKKKKAKKKK